VRRTPPAFGYSPDLRCKTSCARFTICSWSCRTVLASDAEAHSERAKELIRQFNLGGFAYDEFERIQRGPGGSPSQVGTLPADLQNEWCAWLDVNAYVTLNEIVYHAGRLIRSYPHVASALASHFAWLLVDEFQDSSPGQILILKEIHKFGRTTFFCVGDPNQSIYRFAGASPQLLIEFAAHLHANRPGRAMNVKSAVFECAFVRGAVCIPDDPISRGCRIG
jgi:superfamily I DNA/RNA helicase